jgi:hypothetical protein
MEERTRVDVLYRQIQNFPDCVEKLYKISFHRYVKSSLIVSLK